MRLLPLLSVALESDLDPEAFALALHSRVGEGEGAAFSGRVSARGLTITAMRAYRSSHLPVVSGRLSPLPGGGTSARLRLRPHGAVILFMAIWLLFLATTALGLLWQRAALPERPLWPLLVPGGLAGLSWLLLNGVFAADARWVLAHLLERVPELRAAGGTALPGRASMVPRKDAQQGEPHART